MPLTNALLKSMGIEGDQRDQIMAEHQATLQSIKDERDELRDKAAKVADLEGQIEALKAADESDEWKAKYEKAKADAEDAKADAEKLQGEIDSLKEAKDKLQGEFDAYKGDVANEKANAEKLELYKGLLRDIGLDEKRVDKAATLMSLDELTVEDGKLAGYDELKAAKAEEWAEFIPQSHGTHGQNVPNPPKGEPTGDQPNPRAVEIAKQRHEKLYGKSEE